MFLVPLEKSLDSDNKCMYVSQFRNGVKSTVFGVFEDLKFKFSEGYKQLSQSRKTSILVLAF